MQGGHLEFSHALPRRNCGQHVEEELGGVQQSLAGPLLGEEWLRAVIFRFGAVLRLVFLKMEQVSFDMLCIRIYSKLYSMCAGDPAQKGV